MCGISFKIQSTVGSEQLICEREPLLPYLIGNIANLVDILYRASDVGWFNEIRFLTVIKWNEAIQTVEFAQVLGTSNPAETCKFFLFRYLFSSRLNITVESAIVIISDSLWKKRNPVLLLVILLAIFILWQLVLDQSASGNSFSVSTLSRSFMIVK